MLRPSGAVHGGETPTQAHAHAHPDVAPEKAVGPAKFAVPLARPGPSREQEIKDRKLGGGVP